MNEFLDAYSSLELDYLYYGLRMQQNRYAPIYIDYLLQEIKPNLIIEFGTRTGGLAVLLGLWANSNKSKFFTYMFVRKIISYYCIY